MQDNEGVQGVFLTIGLLGMLFAYLYPHSVAVFLVSLTLAFVCGVVPRFNASGRRDR